jgi:hypothetical protein
MRRVAQPRMNRLSRPREEHGFWWGALVTGAGVLMLLFGWGRVTGVETLDEQTAREWEVNAAYAHGGVRRVEVVVTAPVGLELPPWVERELGVAKVYARGRDGRPLVRIDVGAVDPCPT